jgi:hypothetical protein
MTTAAVATIGHNQPPVSIYDEAYARMASLHELAESWLDGKPADSQAQVDELSNLLDEARKAKKEVDNARKTEAKPFDDGKAEVQARYNPLLKNADTIADALKAAMAPFLAKLEAEKRAREVEARRKAEEARREAEAAMQAANRANLAEREAAELAMEAAAKAERIAKAAANDKAKATGGTRAVTLRDDWKAQITDLNAACRHYFPAAREEFQAVVERLAAADVRAGKREIPGFNVINEPKVV